MVQLKNVVLIYNFRTRVTCPALCLYEFCVRGSCVHHTYIGKMEEFTKPHAFTTHSQQNVLARCLFGWLACATRIRKSRSLKNDSISLFFPTHTSILAAHWHRVKVAVDYCIMFHSFGRGGLLVCQPVFCICAVVTLHCVLRMCVSVCVCVCVELSLP